MAENKLILTFTWENRKVFKLTEDDTVKKVTIIQCEENGDLPILWPTIEATSRIYIQSKLEKIGKEMKEK